MVLQRKSNHPHLKMGFLIVLMTGLCKNLDIFEQCIEFHNRHKQTCWRIWVPVNAFKAKYMITCLEMWLMLSFSYNLGLVLFLLWLLSLLHLITMLVLNVYSFFYSALPRCRFVVAFDIRFGLFYWEEMWPWSNVFTSHSKCV